MVMSKDKGKKRKYNCQWIAIHFADAEQAAKYMNDHPELYRAGSLGARSVRMFSSGERIPDCPVEEE